MNRHHSRLGSKISVLAVISIMPWALGATGCSDDSGSGLGDAGLDGGWDATSGQCADGVRNGDETDIDCGGPTCGPCSVGSRCVTDEDCMTESCTDSVCTEGSEDLSIRFVPPTDENNASLDRSWTEISVEAASQREVCLFIDWDETLVGLWHFEDISSGTVTDSSGHDNHGVTEGGPIPTEGRFGQALSFDGSGDSLILPGDPSLHDDGPMTLQVWLRPDEAMESCKTGNNDGNAGVVSMANGTENEWSWQLRFGTPDECLLGFHLNTTSGMAWVNAGTTITPGQWHQVSVTYDGHSLVFYLDGQETDRTAVQGATRADADILVADDGWGNRFHGSIDELRIFSRALSPQEVKASWVLPPRTSHLTRRFESLSQGEHHFQAFATDQAGHTLRTELRTISVLHGDPCAGIDCSGHGQCVVVEDAAECNCDGGYHAVDLSCVPDSPYLHGQPLPRDRPIRILFIGNSFTAGGDIPNRVRSLAESAGWAAPDVSRSAPGGSTLERHRVLNETLALVRQGDWDIVVLQEYSTRPTDNVGPAEQFKADATWFYDEIKTYSPSALIVLYETWARAPTHSIYPGTFQDPAEMQAQLRYHYNDAANNYIPTNATFTPSDEIWVAPVGDAWEAHLDGPDPLRMHGNDDYHAGTNGQYLNAAVLYVTIFGCPVTDLSNLDLSENNAARLQSVADDTVGIDPTIQCP